LILSRRRFLQAAAALFIAPLPLYRHPIFAAPPPPESDAHIVIAAFAAPVRRYAAASAPLIMRVEAGAIMRGMDRIDTGDGGEWIAVSDDTGMLIGWSPAPAWRYTSVR